MATKIPGESLQKGVWKQISTVDCYVQNTSTHTIFIAESASEPTDTSGGVVLKPLDSKYFEYVAAPLYAISPYADIVISVTE